MSLPTAPPGRRSWRVAAAAATVAELRTGLRSFAAAHGAPSDVLANVALAVTEAVTNAVLHAYVDREPGQVEVMAQVAPDELVVAVLDDGRGMQPRPDSPGLGMGLPMIGQLTRSLDIRERPEGGTEVRMRFAAPGVRGPLVMAESDERLQLLAEVARLAKGGGWPQEDVGRLVELLVPALADACALDLLDDQGGAVRVAGRGAEPPMEGRPDGPDATVVAAETEGLAWWVGVPLCDGDRTLGVLRLGLVAERARPGAADLVFLESLGERAARALANARVVADLHRTRHRVERILDCLAEAVTVNDADGRIVYANAKAVELLGATSVEELLATPPGELAGRFIMTHEDGSPVAIDELPGRRLVAGLDAEPLLTRSVLRATGQERWLLTKASLLDDGDPLAVNVIQDVTEARTAELHYRLRARAGEMLAIEPRDLEAVAALVVPSLADWCAIYLTDERGVLQRVAVAHADPAKLVVARGMEPRYPAGHAPGEVMYAIMAGGSGMAFDHVTEEMIAGLARDAEELRVLLEVGMRSAMLVPVRAAGPTHGIMAMVSAESGRTFAHVDLAFAQDLARRVALAIEHA